MEKVLLLTDNKLLRALVNKKKSQIINILTEKEATITQVAHELNEVPANLHHHFKDLQKLKLIKITRKVDTGRNLEKYYRGVAERFIISGKIGRHRETRKLSLEFVGDKIIEGMTSLVTGHKLPLLALTLDSSLTMAQANKLAQKLREIIVPYQSTKSSKNNYRIAIALFPYKKKQDK